MASDSVTVDVSALVKAGDVKLVESDEFPDVFVARMKPESGTIAGALPAERGNEGEFLLAYSRRCSHMGAHLVTDGHLRDRIERTGWVPDIAESGLLRCPCHLTCFDLRREGLVVIGQATAKLAQIELERVSETEVRLVRWLSPAYGELDV